MDPSDIAMPQQLRERLMQPGPGPCSPGHPSAEHTSPPSPSPGSHTVWSCLLETGHPSPSHAFLSRKEVRQSSMTTSTSASKLVWGTPLPRVKGS